VFCRIIVCRLVCPAATEHCEPGKSGGVLVFAPHIGIGYCTLDGTERNCGASDNVLALEASEELFRALTKGSWEVIA